MGRYRCPNCGSNKSWKFKSKHYGKYARKCKECEYTGWGHEWADAARKGITNRQPDPTKAGSRIKKKIRS